jgi:hypothetical protein
MANAPIHNDEWNVPNMQNDFSVQPDAGQSVPDTEGGLLARFWGRSFAFLREKMQYAGSLIAYLPLGGRLATVADPTTEFNNAFGGLLNAHSHKYMNFPGMKDAITGQCNVLLAMFDSNPDLVAENFAEQCEEDRGMEGDPRVGVMLALMTATPEGCELLAKIAERMEQEKFREIFKSTREGIGFALKPSVHNTFNYIHRGEEDETHSNATSAIRVFDLSPGLRQDRDYIINFNCIVCMLGLGQLQLP